MRSANWYFDFISPFAYLQVCQFDRLPKDLQVTPVPVPFGALLKHWGQLGPAEVPPKRTFSYRFWIWHARRIGVPFRLPPSHPWNPLPTLRLCVAAGAGVDATRTIFDAIYVEGLQPDAPETIATLADRLGIAAPDAVLADPQIKARLHQNTDQAIGQDVFGVPTFALEGQLFWGNDSTDMVIDYLADPAMFEDMEMQRVSTMPMGVVRRR